MDFIPNPFPGIGDYCPKTFRYQFKIIQLYFQRVFFFRFSARGRDMKSVLEQYDRHVKPAFDYYIAPSMSHADIIVPRGGENEVAINLIVHHVQSQVSQRAR